MQDFCLKSPERFDFEKVVAATWRIGTSKPAREPHSCASTVSLLSWPSCSSGLALRCSVFSSPAAKAQLEPNKGLNVLQMMIEYPIKSLPTVPDLENPV